MADVRRIDAAIVAEVQAVRVAAGRRRPIAAAATDTAETATIAVASTRSRIPDGGGTAELAGEVQTFVGAVVSSFVMR